MTGSPAKKLEQAIAAYLATISAVSSAASVLRHVVAGADISRPCVIVSSQDATEDEWMRGVYRGSIQCQIEAHSHGPLTSAQFYTLYGALLDALRSEAAILSYIATPMSPWLPLQLRYASAIDYGVTEDDSIWRGAVELECIFHE